MWHANRQVHVFGFSFHGEAEHILATSPLAIPANCFKALRYFSTHAPLTDGIRETYSSEDKRLSLTNLLPNEHATTNPPSPSRPRRSRCPHGLRSRSPRTPTSCCAPAERNGAVDARPLWSNIRLDRVRR